MKNYLLLLLLCFTSFAKAQVCGQLDTTFNAIDNGNTALAGFDGYINIIAVQPDDKILIGGTFASYYGNTANRIIRLNANSTVDNSFVSGTGFNNEVLTISIQTDGKVLVGGNFTSYNGTIANRIIRLNTDGSIDNSFASGIGFNNDVWAIAIQTDGKVLVGGAFTSYNGTTANYIIRLNTDGSIDNTFANGTGFNNNILAISVQTDGKILAGGIFTSYNGTSVNRIIRLNTDGSIDNSFAIGTGFNLSAWVISVQTDGKILVGGNFTSYNGTSANRIIRLNTNGSIDNTFTSGTGFDMVIYAISIQANGKILVGGFFTSYNGTPANYIIRLNTDGSIDNTFAIGTGFNFYVATISVQTNGKILVGGGFTNYNGTSTNYIICLNTDGSIENTFAIGMGFDSDARVISVQTDDKILVGGNFSSYNGTSANHIIRLNTDGSIDNTFASGTGFDGDVNAISVQTDGKILVGGAFTNYNGTSASHIIRLNTDGSIDNTFSSGTGFNNDVFTISIQTDGKVLVGGWFTSYNGTSANNIIRLNTNGSIDNTFATGTGFGFIIRAILVQTDGKILVGGNFASYNGTSANCIIRLNNNGSIDNSFASGTGFDNLVTIISLQTDGKILVGGSFTSYNGTSASRIIRLNTNGSIDNTFAIGTGFDYGVNAISIQTDGKILLGGYFSSYKGTSVNRIIRLNTNGSIDNTFVSGTGFDQFVFAISFQFDGKIFVGGDFSSYNGNVKHRLCRLYNATIQTSPLFNSFLCQGTNRDVSYTTRGQFAINNIFTVELSDAFGSFSNPTIIGSLQSDSAGTISVFIPSGLTPSSNYRVRVVSTSPAAIGTDNGSNLTIAPSINATITANGNTSICAGSSVNLSTTSIAGSSYQWLLNNTPINGANALSYSASATGNYAILVTTFNGCYDTSNVIAVNVYPYPTATITYSGSPYTCTGNTVTLNANQGTGSTYQWQQNGTTIAGSTNSTYTASGTSTNSYTVIVKNAGNCATTSAATILNPVPLAPAICLVTVDSTSTNNLIYWEKTAGDTSIASYYVYRDTSNNNFALIGIVPYDSLSLFIDTLRNLYAANGNPTASSWRYKIAVKDICGTFSSSSPFHQTIFFQDQGNGIFSWSEYRIEGQSTPVSQLNNYKIYRDSISSGNWKLIQTLSASSTSYNDINYALYPNGRWKVEGLWNTSCTPTARIATGVNNTRSNIKNKVNPNVIYANKLIENSVKLQPNPARDLVQVISSMELESIQVFDYLGRIVMEQKVESAKAKRAELNIQALAAGVYTVLCKGNNFEVRKKLVVE